MRIGDVLYFAPGLRFTQVDFDAATVAGQVKRRIVGYYLQPVEECSKHGHAFAAGVLLVSCIDAMAWLRFGGSVGDRFRHFAHDELSSFASDELAARFYEDFRNGLVHEVRIKRGGQFSLELQSTVQELNGVLLVNPKQLAREIRKALMRYVELVSCQDVERARLAANLKRDFAMEFSIVGIRDVT